MSDDNNDKSSSWNYEFNRLIRSIHTLSLIHKNNRMGPTLWFGTFIGRIMDFMKGGFCSWSSLGVGVGLLRKSHCGCSHLGQQQDVPMSWCLLPGRHGLLSSFPSLRPLSYLPMVGLPSDLTIRPSSDPFHFPKYALPNTINRWLWDQVFYI